MALVLYELLGAEGRRFSPFCWRTRMALAHKGLAAELVPVGFTEKERIAFSGQTKVPVLVDGEVAVADSWAIACHLEDAHADRPPLFGGEAGRGAARFINAWTDRVLHPALYPMIIHDLFANVDAADRDYFRKSREERFGARLEDVQKDRDARLPGFRALLDPLRATLEAQPFLAARAPAYADYIVFGAFQWARCASPFALLAADDPVHAWRARMLALFDDLAAAAKGYPC